MSTFKQLKAINNKKVKHKLNLLIKLKIPKDKILKNLFYLIMFIRLSFQLKEKLIRIRRDLQSKILSKKIT